MGKEFRRKHSGHMQPISRELFVETGNEQKASTWYVHEQAEAIRNDFHREDKELRDKIEELRKQLDEKINSSNEARWKHEAVLTIICTFIAGTTSAAIALLMCLAGKKKE